MSFDPTQSALRQAQLLARSDGRSFVLTQQSPSPLVRGDSPAQLTFHSEGAQASDRVLVSWSATYRGEKLQGRKLVAPSELVGLAVAAALSEAFDWFGLRDERADYNGNPNTYNPVYRAPSVITVSSIAPSSGDDAGTSPQVLFLGTGLARAVRVWFGSVFAYPSTVFFDGSMSVVPPASTVDGPVDVRVESVFGPQYDAVLSNAFTYHPPPTQLLSISPSHGAFAGGTAVTITGLSLGGDTLLQLGGADVTVVSVSPDGKTISGVTTSAGVSGAVDLVINTPNGNSTLPGAYSYDMPTVNLILYGNSFTADFGASPSSNGYAELMKAAALARGWTCSVFAYPGTATQTMIGVEGNPSLPGTLLDDISAFTTTADVNILYFQEGSNDIGNNIGQAAVYANFQAACAIARACGCLVVLATTPFASQQSAAQMTTTQNVNQLVRGNWRTFCDALFDQAATLNPDPTSADFASDHLHPSNQGHLKIFTALDPIVQTLAGTIRKLQVQNVFPAQSLAAGGTSLVVQGIGFKAGSIAKLNGAALTNQTVKSGGLITGIAPASASGLYLLEVDNVGSATKGQIIQVAGSQFDPTTLSTACKLWLRATRNVTPQSGTLRDKSLASAWGDASGNASNFSQSTAANAPTWNVNGINGQPALHTQSQGNGLLNAGYLIGPAFSSLTAAHMFCVLAPKWGNTDGTPPGTNPICPWRFGSYADQEYYPFVDGNAYLGWGSTSRKATGVVVPTIPHILEIISTSAEWTMRINGVQVFTTASNVVGFDAAGSLLGANSPGGITPNAFWQGLISEMVIFNAKLSTNDQTAVVAGLGAFYDIHTP